jgi:ubiquinone/menaquinone biosynthesis C-methylase UbiE
MNEKIAQTKDMLAKHHRHGENFAQLMKDTYAGRFNDAFWAKWSQYIAPVLSEPGVVLDLGTGPGMFLRDVAERHPGIHAIGVECADYMLDAAGELPANCEIICADLHDPQLPLADNSVDAAIASVVLHEMHQPVRTLLEMQRCLKPGGVFYILDWVRVPLPQYLAGEAPEMAVFDRATEVQAMEDLFVHFIEHNRFSADDLVFMLENTGFRLLDKELLREGQMARLVVEKV